MKDRISALMDGELDDKSASELIGSLAHGSEHADAWREYHVIRDAMRGTAPLSEGFSARVAWKLADQPTVLAPRRTRPGLAPDSPRWFTLSAIAASFAAVALVGWLAFAPQQPAPAPVLAKVQPPVEKPAMVPMPTSANDYLLAHQGFSPRVSLQGMAPYVLTVAEHPAEARK
jgi:sigma-E factor negative regulatory protein RseA